MKKIVGIFIFVLTLTVSCVRNENYTKTGSGLTATIDSLDIKIQFFSPAIVRIVKSPTGFEYVKKSLSVIKKPEPCKLKVTHKGNDVIVSSEKMKIALNLFSGAIHFLSSDRRLLLSEMEYGTIFEPKKDLGKKTFGVKQTFILDPSDQIYGIGQFQNGRMSRRNQRLFLAQTILETAIPFFQSIRGYGVFWDNYSRTEFADTVTGTSFDSEIGDCSDYYFMVGSNADSVIAQMRDLTGQVPMFPYWTFGYWQSRERYKTQFETVDVVKKYRELGVPLDGIIQDWQYWSTDNAYWNSMNFGNPEFPDPQKMIDQVHEQDAHIIISVWASFGPKTPQYAILEKRGMLLDFKTWPLTGGVKVYDAFNPEARDIYWKFLNKGLFSLGIDGWWLDSTEPDHFDIKDSDYNDKTYLGSFRRVCNAFPLMTVEGVYTHQREVTSAKRVFILTRSAFAGQQRYASNCWSGDVVSTFPNLRKQISAALNFSLCAIPYWNSDIGGFFSQGYKEGHDDPAFRELYVRWLEFGTFSTMMRSHGTATPREIYYFGKKGDWAYDAIDKFINLRYRLLPYIYSTSWEITAHASSMMRALMMDFSRDRKVLDIDDQFMFGKSILVCPVTEQMYTKTDDKGTNEDFRTVKSKKLYLPAGTTWYDFWTGEQIVGGQEIEKPVPVDIMPLYVRAGSIIPMGPKVEYANEKYDPVEIRVYPGKDATFVYYDDERDNYNYEKGDYITITFDWDDRSQTLTIGKQQGEYRGMPGIRNFEIVKVNSSNGIGIFPINESKKKVEYDGSAVQVKL